MIFVRENFFMARRLRALEISTRTACYEAALMGDRIFDPANEPDAHATPGAAGGCPMTEFTVEALRSAVIADGLVPVGDLNPRSPVPVPRAGYYLVAAFMTPPHGPIRDYHFKRQELVEKADGDIVAGKRWCHNLIKGAFACPTYTIGGKARVFDPRKAIEDISTMLRDKDGNLVEAYSRYSVFAGFFECPIGGLDVASRPQSRPRGWETKLVV